MIMAILIALSLFNIYLFIQIKINKNYFIKLLLNHKSAIENLQKIINKTQKENKDRDANISNLKSELNLIKNELIQLKEHSMKIDGVQNFTNKLQHNLNNVDKEISKIFTDVKVLKINELKK